MEAGLSKVVAVDTVPATKSDREKNDRRVEMPTISSLRCSSLVVGGGDVGAWNATVPSSGEMNTNTSNHFILLEEMKLEA